MPGEKIRAGTITITGHRDYPDRAGLFRGLDRVEAKRYFLGGARGADADALKYLAETQAGSRRTVVVPNRIENQPFAVRPVIKQYATEIIELKNTGADRFQQRNHYMVDRSDRVAAFYDGRKTGGTYNTIQYAELKGIPVDTIRLTLFDIEEIHAMTFKDFHAWLDGVKIAKIPQMSIKSLAIGKMKMFPRVMWPGILEKIHSLP